MTLLSVLDLLHPWLSSSLLLYPCNFAVPWTARRSNQSILKEINPEYSLERLLLKVKRQYFGHLMQSANSLEKTLMLGKIEGKGRRGRQRMGWLDSITDSVDMNLSKLWEIAENREAWRAAVHRVRHDLATEHQQSCGAPTPIITPGRVFSPTLEPWPQLCD